jgi:hypothetical protein
MQRTNRKNKAALTGVYCLPTSSRFHPQEVKRSGAYKEGQVAYILTATQSVEEGGYPEKVVLTADEGTLDWNVGDEPETQHAEVRKNLPPRRVTGIVFADGSTDGELTPKGLGLPHWAFITSNEDGSANVASIQAAKDALDGNRAKVKAEKEALRQAKNGAKAAPAAS